MNLIEQRALYMQRLQSLVDSRQKDIDNKVAVLRAKLEAEQIQPYRAQLEAEKVTPEMSKLIEFINNIDAMLEYDKSEANKVESATQTEVTSTSTSEVEEENIANDEEANTDSDAKETDYAEDAEKDCFKAISDDIADTKARLNAAAEGRPGMAGIVLPRR